MLIHKSKQALLNLKARFPYGDHYGDCDFYRSMQVYGTSPCTCGFLYALERLPGDLATKINKNFHEDLSKKDGIALPVSEEKREEAKKFLEKLFNFQFGVQEESEESKLNTWLEWELIEEVFGKSFRDTKEGA